MLEPSVTTLMEHVPSRFMLVNVAAQRARSIAEQAEMRQLPLQAKAISLAIRELADGKLRAYPYYGD
ncbi:MAG: DNA-directed RNA polymerase subunit omega [Oscillospiraceae bacterium]|nr:DNA-directed RNA polymerase subunit omega [Oscillospiraceae bacterium]